MSATRTSAAVSIPHPHQPDTTLVGTLEHSGKTEGKKIALILHGSGGHKDYVYQKRLAQRLPVDSFRFDFRGCHESTGTWREGAIDADIEDIQVVVDFLKETYAYVVDIIVGHSRGSISAMHWLCTSPDAASVSAFVNVSSRYRLEKLLDTAVWLTEESRELLRTQGYYLWSTTVARKPVQLKVYDGDLERFMKLGDTSIVWTRFPKGVNVLTVHGLDDAIVPVYDATLWAQAYEQRHPGTHNLHLVEDCGHNFSKPGQRDALVAEITRWYELHRNEQLRTGVWRTVAPEDAKGKL
ncbi:alpha/beta-hydrolase [Cylindrobasidium torrendii FP15055 ss-10]|uniref:Alpha/beta-hydrolase n=1 Tax=Cylindrobasidium torrendii FP15055 ss-10 TaxID=1314674 RepID=A0A0D7BE93_9AGAR|nr:alpha/beta-hydrolase [Cylindrobasidium torrendii FP15055 ss-10]